MSVYLLIGLVLLPVGMYGLALALAVGRQWMGRIAIPHARNVARSIRAAARQSAYQQLFEDGRHAL